MTMRKLFALALAASLATACTSIIGLEDLPPAPVYDAGSGATQPPPTPTTEASTDAGGSGG